MKVFRLILLSVAVALSLLLCAGCGRNAQSEGSAPASPSETSESAQSSSASGEPRSHDESFEVSLGFIGDICLADNYVPMEHLKEINSTDISDGIDRRFIDKMNEVDLMWANNEFVLSDRGEPLDGKAYTFRGATANVSYLHDLGIDIVGLANNHTFDYGREAFLDTLDTLKNAGIPYVGAGHDFKEASAPMYMTSDGVTFAYVAASSAEYTIYTPEAAEDEPGIMWCYDDEKFLDEIREAAKYADFVIALPHWGTEHSTVLEPAQIESAHAYIDAGADAVIGAHPHILQGIEYYEGKPIMYSLGNFWFDDYDIDTLLAELRIHGKRDANGKSDMQTASVELVVHPGTQSGVFTSWAETDDERDRIFRYLEEISDDQVSISNEGLVSASE
jgi:poly-gamma-glutamate synthesis protein (capsule biosynthesis protein)